MEETHMSLREEALQYHQEHNGKLGMIAKMPLRDGYDLSGIFAIMPSLPLCS